MARRDEPTVAVDVLVIVPEKKRNQFCDGFKRYCDTAPTSLVLASSSSDGGEPSSSASLRVTLAPFDNVDKLRECLDTFLLPSPSRKVIIHKVSEDMAVQHAFAAPQEDDGSSVLFASLFNECDLRRSQNRVACVSEVAARGVAVLEGLDAVRATVSRWDTHLKLFEGSGSGAAAVREGPAITRAKYYCPDTVLETRRGMIVGGAAADMVRATEFVYVKTDIACGKPESHLMALVRTEDWVASHGVSVGAAVDAATSESLDAVRFPRVVQAAITSDVVYKVYAVGPDHISVRVMRLVAAQQPQQLRSSDSPSAPSVADSPPSESEAESIGFHRRESSFSFQSQDKGLFVTVVEPITIDVSHKAVALLGKEDTSGGGLLSSSRVAAIVDATVAIQQTMGLSLLGVDLVFPSLTSEVPFVIDVNYFPSYKGVAAAYQHVAEWVGHLAR